MNFEFMPFIYSKSVYYFNEYDINALYKEYIVSNSIIFEEYDFRDEGRLIELIKAHETKHFPFTIDDVKRRYMEGHTLYVAKDKDMIIGVYWVGSHFITVPYFHATIYLEDDEIVTYNAYIVDEYRGKRIFNNLKAFALYSAKQRGYKKQLGYIKSTNKSSLRTIELFGSRIIGKLVYYTIFTLEFHYHNLTKYKVSFHGGSFRLWKGLYQKLRSTKYCWR